MFVVLSQHGYEGEGVEPVEHFLEADEVHPGELAEDGLPLGDVISSSLEHVKNWSTVLGSNCFSNLGNSAVNKTAVVKLPYRLLTKQNIHRTESETRLGISLDSVM